MARFATNEEEVVNPPSVLHCVWNTRYQRGHEKIRTVCPVVDGSEIAFDITVAQCPEAIAVVAVPSAHVFDLGVSLLKLAKEGLLIGTVWHKLHCCSDSIGSAGQEIDDGDGPLGTRTNAL